MKLGKSDRNQKALNITNMDEARNYIGKKCAKFSGKPFKSGNKINTITGVGQIIPTYGNTVLTMTEGYAKVTFYFDEDKTLVSCDMVYIVEE